jgi:1-acyl-sn-glycerol-3-phosphate acyltransferase
MQNIVIDKPYQFVPPYRGLVWPWILLRGVPWWLRNQCGIVRVDVQGGEHIRASVQAGHGILVTPNHSRPADPPVMMRALHQLGAYPHFMASWHVFQQNWWEAFFLRRMGAFSVYREGLDRTALTAATEILATAQRPLVIFPEGVVSRTNDRLNPFMEGPTFVARSAAKKRAKGEPAGQVVIHPAFLKYYFDGDLEPSILPTLREIERRLSWSSQEHRSLRQRVFRVGNAILSLKEIEYLDWAQTGTVAERLQRLIDALLVPLEKEWLGGAKTGSVVSRVKQLRIAVLPDLVKGDISEEERIKRWRHLGDVYLAQQVDNYPPDYIDTHPSKERVLETVERFEEDLTDVCRVYSPMSVTVTFGPAIAVSPERQRGESDPLTAELEKQMQALLEASFQTQHKVTFSDHVPGSNR